MIGVTAILKKTLHEDNSKAETYDALPLQDICMLNIVVQIHGC